MLVLKYIKDPNFRGVFIRQTSTQLSQAGGLFMEAQAMWRSYGAKFKSHPQMTAIFPSGAEVQFKVCGADRDINNFDGGQFSMVVFDEAQWHSEVQIKYLESRIRSKAKGPHQLICTANPSRVSYLYQFVQPYLDMETGIPKPEMSGKEFYYAVYQGATVIGETKEALIEKYGPTCKPQSYTYISATVADNPIMKQLNPAYVDRLENLKRTERERLYLGSWHAKEEAAGFFKRDWVEEITHLPDNIVNRVRGYDLAGSVPSESNPNPDWTASVMISKTSDGYYIVEHAERYRKLINGVLENIVETDKRDKSFGYEAAVYLPTDPGQAGKAANMFFIRTLVEAGVDARTEASSTTGKLSRMQPFLTLAESGFVKVLVGEWNEAWYNELEDYQDGNRQQKDDFWDATGTAAKAMMKQITVPSFIIPVFSNPSPVPKL